MNRTARVMISYVANNKLFQVLKDSGLWAEIKEEQASFASERVGERRNVATVQFTKGQEICVQAICFERNHAVLLLTNGEQQVNRTEATGPVKSDPCLDSELVLDPN